jgi:hypothetical protein
MIYEILNMYVGNENWKIPFVFSLMKTGAGSWYAETEIGSIRKGMAHAGVENIQSLVERTQDCEVGHSARLLIRKRVQATMGSVTNKVRPAAAALPES